MFRYFVELAYDGEAYAGWQRQKNAIGVQQVIEETLARVLRLPAVPVLGSGRTDTGVHARKQVLHLDLPFLVKHEELWIKRMNVALPGDIVFKRMKLVGDDCHARFSAVLRSYEYWICQNRNPFLRGKAHFVYQALDVGLMSEASQFLLGEKDFTSFSKVHTDVNHFRCRISRAEWVVAEDEKLVFHISADRFLRGMVRAVVGTLLQVGLGRIAVKDFDNIINAMDRKKAGQNAPACGLYLTEVKYPDSIF